MKPYRSPFNEWHQTPFGLQACSQPETTRLRVCCYLGSYVRHTVSLAWLCSHPFARATHNSAALSALNSFCCAQACGAAALCSLAVHRHRYCAGMFVVTCAPREEHEGISQIRLLNSSRSQSRFLLSEHTCWWERGRQAPAKLPATELHQRDIMDSCLDSAINGQLKACKSGYPSPSQHDTTLEICSWAKTNNILVQPVVPGYEPESSLVKSPFQLLLNLRVCNAIATSVRHTEVHIRFKARGK